MAGSLIGHVVADKLLGGRSNEGAVAAPVAAPMATNDVDQCVLPKHSLSECMSQNSSAIASCQWAYDMLNECIRDPVGYKNKFT